MTTQAASTQVAGPLRLTRAAAFSRSESGIVVLALAAVALHILDDNYLQPRPGTSAGDHLTSGLVPLAILFGVATAYSYLPAALRAATAVTFGGLGLAIGFPGAYYMLDGSVSGAQYTSLLAIAGGAALLLSGPVTLWRARRRGGTRRKRYLRGTVATILAALAVAAIGVLVVFPIAFSYGYTHVGRTGSSPALGIPHEAVTITTSDSLELAASYVPSKNRAAVVVFPGASAVKEARMLVRHGYGVLLLDPRGQGRSEGDLIRWAGDRDLIAGAEYLQVRPDVDPARIGGFGSSVGGETLIEAAAQSTAFKAVVSEGAGFPIGEADLTGANRVLFAPLKVMMTAATTVFSNHGPPPRIVDRIGEIAPRPVFLIYAEPGMGGEATRQPKYYGAAGEPKSIWKVPGSKHTGGIDVQPAEYERRVVAFFDDALLKHR
jgi:uncharacterized protein